MNSQEHNLLEDMVQLAEIDVLSTDDQTLVELAHCIVDRLKAGHLKIVDLSNITSDNRYIRVKALRMPDCFNLM